MPFITLSQAKDQTFDYVLVGGGTAGLTLAARLTEDPNINVLVLEAGGHHLDDPVINRPCGSGIQMGNPKYDWLHKTTPQKYAGDRQYIWNRGKGLGGSSAMNFTCLIPPPAHDIDHWEKLGNPGWNWQDYKKYLDRATSYRVEERDKDTSSPLVRAREAFGCGPVKASYPRVLPEVDIKLQQTFLGMGIPKAEAPNAGDPSGTYYGLNTIDPETLTRSYAASAYYAPNASRPNFAVLLRAYGTRIITEDQAEGLSATGVEFTFREARDVYVVHARKEVILCAGSLKSPQILELSGIGRPSVLSSIGIPVKLALEGLGENVQEHNYLPVPFQLKDSVVDETYDLLFEPDLAIKHVGLHPEGKGLFNVGITNMTFVPLDTISPQADQIHEAEREFIKEGTDLGKYPPVLAEQYELQMERIAKRGAGCEIAVFPGFLSGNPETRPLPGKRYISIVLLTSYPFSRGTIHCTSDDPHVDPAYDPHYFEHDIDLQTIVEMVKFARKIALNAPFTDTLESTQSVSPDSEVQTDEQLGEWVKDNMLTTYHTAGPASMLPREKGGVVDPRLKVYGTTNIRVVDMSIVPLHFAGHAQSTAYVIGEKAADIIKGAI